MRAYPAPAGPNTERVGDPGGREGRPFRPLPRSMFLQVSFQPHIRDLVNVFAQSLDSELVPLSAEGKGCGAYDQ